jgi:transmembrane sensor
MRENARSAQINTATTARVKFSDAERHVELVSGEALFDVARDVARPFVVEAGRSRVRALQTSFSVRKLSDADVQVSVRQGMVQIMRPASAGLALLAANTRTVVSDGGSDVKTSQIAPNELTRELAWRQGMLSFEDEPLREAAAEFARYSDTAIRFDDSAIGDETITGLYAANDPQGFARSAALSLGLRSAEQPGSVTLSR